ncbi:C40 family peptidase [Nonomuraea turcica]|uniref:C40 family peptidase n=1 Tax=Nonomuraea sp. G32 TaxID=3067274 RepID=UPI00273C3524|nr:NlpC/P60 family protein [Nonomuraea sp. G32]MDP4502597.1 NlpC/P60 family protein [Nonomuraea sp. G32]
MKPRIMTLIVAFVVAVSSAVFVSAPSASADGLSNPSGTLTVSCGGAEAFIQVDWKRADQVTVRWRIEDTGTEANRSPVLRIQARGAEGGEAPFIFPSGETYFILRGGNGHHEIGLKSDWNPDNIPNINHLRVKVQNGTTEQGVFCYQERDIFNWSMIAHKNAVAKRGEPYIKQGIGTPQYPGYDCSGLVYASYNPIANFPGWPVRRAVEMWNWANNNQNPGKFYAKAIDYSDLKVGDLIFYKTTAEAVGHVAFWEGDGQIFDALQEGTNVDYHPEGGLYDNRVAAFRILGVDTVATVVNP